VTGGGGRAGAWIDCLQLVDKRQTAKTSQHAGRNSSVAEDLVNSSERRPDLFFSEKKQLGAW
jgi:hypothetical protein